MAPKIAKKIRSKVAHKGGNVEHGESSRGEKRPSSSRPPISPASKRSKSTHNVPVEDRFDAQKFIDLQAARLYKALSKARISDSKVFDFCSLHECGLELFEAFNIFGIRRFAMVGDDFYPELVKEFYANARKWENRDSEDTLNFGNIGVSSRVNGQEIILGEGLLFDLFGLSNKGCIVKKRKRVTDFFDEQGEKVTVEIESIRRTLLEKAGVVAVEATLLDQNDLGVF